MAKYNLIIFHKPGWQLTSDYLTIRTLMAERAPDIAMFIITPDSRLPNNFWSRMAECPSVLFASQKMRVDPAVRGARLIPVSLRKLAEVQLLIENGFPVPRAQVIGPQTVLDEADWGPFVVVKPNRGSRGRGVRLARTKDVRWSDTASLPEDDPRHGKELLVQRYIHTGPFPSCYRVMTVLGSPVYSSISIGGERLPQLDAAGSEVVDLPVAANSQGRRMELAYDEDVLALAGEIHRKLTHTPVMGIDIVREYETRKLYVLELNSGGGTWALSSNLGLRLQREHGLDYASQFGALDIITERFIEATRRLAI